MIRAAGLLPTGCALLVLLLALLPAASELHSRLNGQPDGMVLAVAADELGGGSATADATIWSALRLAGVEALVVREPTVADAAGTGELSLAAGSEILTAFRINAVSGGYLYELLRNEKIRPELTYVFTGQRNREAVRDRLRAVFGEAAVAEPGRQRWTADYRIIAVLAPRRAVERMVLRPPQLPAWLEQPPPWLVMREPLLPETRQAQANLLRLVPDGGFGWRLVTPGDDAAGRDEPGVWRSRAAELPLTEWPQRAVRLAGYENVRLAWLRLAADCPLPVALNLIRQGRSALAAAGFAADGNRFTARRSELPRLPAGLAVAGLLFPAVVVLLRRCLPQYAPGLLALAAGIVTVAGYLALADLPVAPVAGLVLLLALLPPAIAGGCAPRPAVNVSGGRGTLLLLARTLFAVLLALLAGLVMQMTNHGLTEALLDAHCPLLAGAALTGALLTAILAAREPLTALRGWLARPLTGGAFGAGLLAILALPAFAARFALQPPHRMMILFIGFGITALAWHYLALFTGNRKAAGWLALPAGLGLAVLLAVFAQPQALPWLAWQQVAVALAPGLAALPLTLLLAVGWLGLSAKWRDIGIM